MKIKPDDDAPVSSSRLFALMGGRRVDDRIRANERNFRDIRLFGHRIGDMTPEILAELQELHNRAPGATAPNIKERARIMSKSKLDLGEHRGDRFIPRTEVTKILGVTHDTLSAWEAEGLMPKSIPMGKRTRVYAASKIEPWLAQKMDEAKAA